MLEWRKIDNVIAYHEKESTQKKGGCKDSGDEKVVESNRKLHKTKWGKKKSRSIAALSKFLSKAFTL